LEQTLPENRNTAGVWWVQLNRNYSIIVLLL
jgi:hypothetical protein